MSNLEALIHFLLVIHPSIMGYVFLWEQIRVEHILFAMDIRLNVETPFVVETAVHSDTTSFFILTL